MTLAVPGRVASALDTARSTTEMRGVVGVVLGLSLVAHLVLILSTQGAAPDIQHYLIQAQSVFDHRNVYDVTMEYPYPPVWIWLVTFARWLSGLSGMPFYMVVKLPGTLADFGITFVLYDSARAWYGASYRAVLPSALYALNPVTLLISAGHGQFDALVILFLLLAIHAKRGGALALGVAIALKGFPVLFLPYILQWSREPRRAVVLALLPILVSMAIYSLVFGFSPHMLLNVIGYRSTADFGWLYVLLHVPGVSEFVVSHPASMLLLLAFSALLELAIIAFALVIPARWFPSQPALAVTLVFAAWFATTMTMGAQYTLWILPFLCLALPVEAVVFSLCALLGIVTFYAQPLVTGALFPLPQPVVAALSQPSLHMVGVLAIIVCSISVFMKLRAKREFSDYYAECGERPSGVTTASIARSIASSPKSKTTGHKASYWQVRERRKTKHDGPLVGSRPD